MIQFFARSSLILGSALFLSVGCITAPPLASGGDDQRAKQFSPARGKAAIYVYRKGGWRGSHVGFPVTVDGRFVGWIAKETYYVIEADAGDHEVWVGWDSTMTSQPPASVPATLRGYSVIPIKALAGRTYFVRAGQTDQAHQAHQAVPESQGMEELSDCCKLALTLERPKESPLFK